MVKCPLSFSPLREPLSVLDPRVMCLLVNGQHFDWSSCLQPSYLGLEPGVRVGDELDKIFL